MREILNNFDQTLETWDRLWGTVFRDYGVIKGSLQGNPDMSISHNHLPIDVSLACNRRHLNWRHRH